MIDKRFISTKYWERIFEVNNTRIITKSQHLIPYSFVVAGHAYGEPGGNNSGLFPPFVDSIKRETSDREISFLVLGGDVLRAPSTVNYELMRTQLGFLANRVYIAPGNHDVGSNQDEDLIQLFEREIGPRYQKIVYQEDLFIFLDTNNLLGDRGREQIKFLRETLRQVTSDSITIFVFTHHPIWWDAEARSIEANLQSSNESLYSRLKLWIEMEGVFSNLKNNVVMISGDVGRLPNQETIFIERKNNINLLVTSMGRERRDNILIVNVSDGAITFEARSF